MARVNSGIRSSTNTKSQWAVKWGRCVEECLSFYILGILVLCVGCGDPTEFPVTGRVTLGGDPLPHAMISFVSDDPDLAPAVARTDSNGVYHAEISDDRPGLAVGTYRVRISTYEEGDQDVQPPIPTVPERVPSKYNYESQLQVVTKPEACEFNFDLNAKGKLD